MLCFVALQPAFTQHMNEPESACAKVVITAELSASLVNAYKSSDTTLNTVYEKIRTTLDAAEPKQLTEAQRLWIQYRDANCTAERDLYEGGTASFPAHEACLEAMTRQRTAEVCVTYAVRLKD